MSIEERQMIDKNRKGKNTGIGILIFGFILCALGFAAGIAITFQSVFRVALFGVLLVIYLIVYTANKNSKNFMIFGTVILTIAYITVVFFTTNTYMYAYIYLMLFYIMIYMDIKFTKICTAIYLVLSIASSVKFAIKVEGSTDVALIQCVFSIFAIVVVYNIVSISNRHSDETMEAILANAQKEGDVNRQIALMSDELAGKFEIAKQTSQNMTLSMGASDTAVSEISQSIKITANAIEDQTRLTSDIQTNLENTDKNTQRMHEAAEASATAVKTGKEAMRLLAEQAELTGALNRRSQETTAELGQRIHDVDAITGEILNISSQTNLLALNASIEAARAGEAGRGFAVVAEEIRHLSEQTKDSVNKITEIINGLVENSNEASATMSQSIEATGRQNQMVEDAISSMNEIDEKNSYLIGLMEQISEQIREILTSNTQINDSISNLSAMSQEVAASSERSQSVMSESMGSVSTMNDLLGEIYNISQKMADLTK